MIAYSAGRQIVEREHFITGLRGPSLIKETKLGQTMNRSLIILSHRRVIVAADFTLIATITGQVVSCRDVLLKHTERVLLGG